MERRAPSPVPYRALLKSGRLRRLLMPADVVALQLAIKSGAADAKHFPSQSLVPLDLRKNALDGGALDIFQVSGAQVGGAAGEFCRPRRFCRFGADFRVRDGRRQIVDLDNALVAESDGSLQAVFQ